MNQWILSGAVGLVCGIIATRFQVCAPESTAYVIIAGLVILFFSFILVAARKLFWPLTLAAFFCLGYANTSWRLNTSAPGHLDQVVKIVENERDLTLEGIVFQPPDVRESYTILPLEIVRLTRSDTVPIPVRRGHVYVRIYPSVGEVYSSIGYGDRITFTSIRMHAPLPASNPGEFDMRMFLNNQGFFATTSVREPRQIQKVITGIGNPLIHFSELVKNRLLITIKETLPYPESSFLGGVLLGLRSGLSTEIKDTFRAAGVSHVLAVSGLHVTIITLFFMGMFKLLRIPRTSSFIVIVCALILFTLITGARPSTVRAAIMNGVTLLFFYFRGIKLDRSLLLGISIAAIYILFRNPLLLTEASFLFSFSAVLSLALLTRPILRLCAAHLTGFFRIILFFEFIIAAGFFAISPSALFQHRDWLIAGIIFPVAGAIADRFIPPFIEFRRWPAWLSTFFAAQISIQLGMLPLTALFFKKISVAAPMANFIAIPLIGVIVQLGLFAGILGNIPIVGPYLSLSLNAANWLFIKLFLSTATFFGTHFPYPDVSPPSPQFLFTYYMLLLLIASWLWIRMTITPRFRYIVSNWLKPSILVRLLLIAGTSGYLINQWLPNLKPAAPRCIITCLEPSVFFMGGGNALLIQTPGGHHFLVDAGPQYVLRQNQPVLIDVGKRIIIPALLDRKTRHLDGIILTAADSQNAGGISSVIDNQWVTVSMIYHGLPFKSLDGDENTDDILKMLGDTDLFQGNNRRRSELTAWALRDLFAAARDQAIPIESIREGSVIIEESIANVDGTRPFVIRVLNPPRSPYTGSYSTRSNSVVLEVEFGDFRAILLSNAGKSVQADILSRHPQTAQVIQLAANGAEYAFNSDFITGAKAVIVSPLPTRWAQKEMARTREIVKSMNIELFGTDMAGAVTVSSDGSDLEIRQLNVEQPKVLIP